MSTFFLIAGALALSLALVWMFTRPMMGTVAAYFGAWAMMKSGYAPMSPRTLSFWAIVIILIAAIQMVRGRTIPVVASLSYYLAGGSLAFTLVGCLWGQAGMIVGSVVGLIIGSVAFMRLKHAPWLRLRSAVVASGAPTVATSVLLALTLMALIQRSQLL